MKYYVGIDLGTTNSAISIYDGEDVTILKSPEQNDVTPSAILIDRRGNKYIGKRAYDAAPGNPDNAALLFKRLMGSSTKLHFASVGKEMTPEECSSEVLKVLYGYLPEEIRLNDDIGTVITVPAAFNQMQRDATVHAASMAGIGKMALMQEPVAAVMSVMRHHPADGVFLIYDFGGGTLDVAIAEKVGGRVSLLANGGIQMCGGRDIDRSLFDNIVKPWLLDRFNLPTDFIVHSEYKRLIRFANWAIEKAKIELSAREDSVISLSEMEACTHDLSGEEIYIDIPLTRTQLMPLMEEKIQESVKAVRETIRNAGFEPSDIGKIVFIGGPTNYKPLRDRISMELGIAGSTEVNPMTAVSEGAAVFAESIDWETHDNARKSSRGKLSAAGLNFIYSARTPENYAKLVVQLSDTSLKDAEFQVDSLGTGWTSGRIKLEDGASVRLILTSNGDNNFKVFLFAKDGSPITLAHDLITICRTAATVDAIPASHSIGVAVKERLGGGEVMAWLIRAGDSLPRKGQLRFTAAETLRAGTPNSLNFNLWEGEIEDPISDNRHIGTLKIRGVDLDEGVIPAGAELICDYELLDSGLIHIEVSVPSIGATFPSDRNFYSRQEGQIDFETARGRTEAEQKSLECRVEDILTKGIQEEKINDLLQKLGRIKELINESDVEKNQEAQERLLEVKRDLSKIRVAHLAEIRHMELEKCHDFFENKVRAYAKPSEASAFDALYRTAQRSIDRKTHEFESTLHEIKTNNFVILWRQDWFVVDYFRSMIKFPHQFTDRALFEQLCKQGQSFLQCDDISNLRQIVFKLMDIRIYLDGGSDTEEEVNIIRS